MSELSDLLEARNKAVACKTHLLERKGPMIAGCLNAEIIAIDALIRKYIETKNPVEPGKE